ncbi:unnamed protein product [Prorocentrum cordatum]|uniref:RRM domain-containing protein n=1 Tax=Prorocentrum cordatum TaxID=2364126 RepID=A0ABN9R8B4_9DINO|nr:unnamed protein product [Polarella glacialis]
MEAAAAKQQQAGHDPAVWCCERTSRRRVTWPQAAGDGRLAEPDAAAEARPEARRRTATATATVTATKATKCPSRSASKDTITTEQELTASRSTTAADDRSSCEDSPKQSTDADIAWGSTDSEGSDYDSSSGASCTVKKANWADQTDQEFGPVIEQVIGDTSVLQQRADKSELQALTTTICQAPPVAPPPMHARKYVPPGSRCRAAWAPQQSQLSTASPQSLTPSRRGSSSAVAGSDGGVSPTGDGTNRSAHGRPKKMKAAGITPKLGKVTTLMVRNLPAKLKQQDFVWELNASGFEGTFDICYIPRDFSSGRCKGYAFVNFKLVADACRFHATWHHTERFGCREHRLDVSPAQIQGYEANAAKANSSHVAKVRNPSFRALIINKDQAAEPQSPLGSPSSLSPAGFSTQLGRAAAPLVSSQGPPCPEAGERAAGSVRPAPQELLGFPAPTPLQHRLPPRPLATSPAVLPRAVPDGVMVVVLMGSPQHSMLQECPAIQVNSTPNYGSVVAH